MLKLPPWLISWPSWWGRDRHGKEFDTLRSQRYIRSFNEWATLDDLVRLFNGDVEAALIEWDENK